MTLEQRTRMAILYDLYSGLLTEKQKNVFDLYYQCDLSLGEIAAEQQTSRTAVFDLVKRTEQLLEKYEAGLVLHGTEVKSLRLGKCSIKEGYAGIEKEWSYLDE